MAHLACEIIKGEGGMAIVQSLDPANLMVCPKALSIADWLGLCAAARRYGRAQLLAYASHAFARPRDTEHSASAAN